MGLVYSVVKRFSGRNREVEDLVQIGAIGLIKAAKRFDPGYGVQFSTYAVPMIIGEIKRFLRDDGAVKVSRSIKETAIRGRRAEETLRGRLGRDPGINEIARECGAEPEELLRAFDAAAPPQSIYAETGGGDEGGRRMLEMIAADDVEERIVDRVFLKEAMAQLTEREQRVLIMRYFRGRTQSEIAAVIGVSQVQVSRIEKKALERLREKAVQ